MDPFAKEPIAAARPAGKPGLLVSVRDVEEARVALAAGVDLIDVKEPANGALGAASPAIVKNVVATVGNRVPVSAALGELADWDQGPWSHRSAWDRLGHGSAHRIGGPSFAKLGLARCAADRHWPRAWQAALAILPADLTPVAVVYADWETAGAPRPDRVLQVGCRLGCRVVLIDTFNKHQGPLLKRWPLAEIAHFAGRVRACKRLLVLAGSLTAESVPAVLPLQPDYVAVRGAVCDGGRRGAVNPQRVRVLAAALACPEPAWHALSPVPHGTP